jgi:hypothetical protein
MWEPNEQEYAVAFLVLSSVGGSVVGAIAGAFVQANKSLPWLFWTQLLVGGGVQAVHFFLNPETRATVLLDREAKRRRKNGETNVYGPNELRKISLREVWTIWYRPFYMFFTEPIVLWLSLLSGFSDALIFTFLESFQPVYKQWGFGTTGVGLAFIPSVSFTVCRSSHTDFVLQTTCGLHTLLSLLSSLHSPFPRNP